MQDGDAAQGMLRVFSRPLLLPGHVIRPVLNPRRLQDIPLVLGFPPSSCARCQGDVYMLRLLFMRADTNRFETD